MCSLIRSENRRKRPKFEKFPVKFPVSRELTRGDRFARDCLVSQAVGSPGCYFPVCENPRHSRGLRRRAPVSGRQFAAFRPSRGGFRAPVSGRHFPISISVGQRPVRLQTETGSQSALGGLVIIAAATRRAQFSAPARPTNRAGLWRDL